MVTKRAITLKNGVQIFAFHMAAIGHPSILSRVAEFMNLVDEHKIKYHDRCEKNQNLSHCTDCGCLSFVKDKQFNTCIALTNTHSVTKFMQLSQDQGHPGRPIQQIGEGITLNLQTTKDQVEIMPYTILILTHQDHAVIQDFSDEIIKRAISHYEFQEITLCAQHGCFGTTNLTEHLEGKYTKAMILPADEDAITKFQELVESM